MQIFPGTSFLVPASPLFCLGLFINMWGCCYRISFSQRWASLGTVLLKPDVRLGLRHTELLLQVAQPQLELLGLQVSEAPPATAPNTQKEAHINFCTRFKRKHHGQL